MPGSAPNARTEIVIQASAGLDGFLETILHGGDSAPDPTDPAVTALDADRPVVRSPAPSADDESGARGRH
ncbi:hypothetical protein D8S78_24255 [Natrialba swarupiae]|nr:hypothetical protein [Natrialba swarupiae]